MRERLAKDTGATYTYSVDYVSQTVSLVDEFRLREDEEVSRFGRLTSNFRELGISEKAKIGKG